MKYLKLILISTLQLLNSASGSSLDNDHLQVQPVNIFHVEESDFSKEYSVSFDSFQMRNQEIIDQLKFRLEELGIKKFEELNSQKNEIFTNKKDIFSKIDSIEKLSRIIKKIPNNQTENKNTNELKEFLKIKGKVIPSDLIELANQKLVELGNLNFEEKETFQDISTRAVRELKNRIDELSKEEEECLLKIEEFGSEIMLLKRQVENRESLSVYF